jgi:hypothetical protein
VMPRLFAALSIPVEVASALAAARGGVFGARWIEPGDYHVTLRFVGDVDVHAAREVAGALAAVRRPPVAVEFQGLSWFGGDKPRAIVARIRRRPLSSNCRAISSAGCVASACRRRRAISRRMSPWRGCAESVLPRSPTISARAAASRRRRSRPFASPSIRRAIRSAGARIWSRRTMRCNSALRAPTRFAHCSAPPRWRILGRS